MPVNQRVAAAAQATYVGSAAHKIPHSRSDASLCPADLHGQQESLTIWLRQAIREGHIGGLTEGGFPRYVWYRDGSRV